MSKKDDSALRFYNEVLGLERLHYGMWLPEDELSIEKLKEAQVRYEDFLVEMIPEGVQSVLDVGCGTGALTKKLLSMNYAAEALSPDINQKKVFTESIDAPFHHSSFEKFEAPHKYDCLIMSESAQYIKKRKLFENARNALNPGGYLMICDYFVIDTDPQKKHSGHRLEKFMNFIDEYNFEIIYNKDITDDILNTLRLAKMTLDKALLALNILTQKVRKQHRFLSSFVMWLFRKRIAKLMGQIRLLDAEEFKKNKNYRFLLLQVRN